MAKRFIVQMALTEDELHGLSYLTDAFEEWRRCDTGTGSDALDAQALAAARWVGRAVSYAYAHPILRKATKPCP